MSSAGDGGVNRLGFQLVVYGNARPGRNFLHPIVLIYKYFPVVLLDNFFAYREAQGVLRLLVDVQSQIATRCSFSRLYIDYLACRTSDKMIKCT